MNKAVLVLAWLAFLGLGLALLVATPEAIEARTDTERFQVIAADPEVHFALDPDEERVRIIFWTSAPARWARDVRAWEAFQIDLPSSSAHAPGRALPCSSWTSRRASSGEQPRPEATSRATIPPLSAWSGHSRRAAASPSPGSGGGAGRARSCRWGPAGRCSRRR